MGKEHRFSEVVIEVHGSSNRKDVNKLVGKYDAPNFAVHISIKPPIEADTPSPVPSAYKYSPQPSPDFTIFRERNAQKLSKVAVRSYGTNSPTRRRKFKVFRKSS